MRADTTAYDADLAALAWQVELGADEATGDAPLNRYEFAEPAATVNVPTPPPEPAAPSLEPSGDPVAVAKAMALATGSLDDLHAALSAFEGCELKKGARNLVFADGNPAARVMVIGEAPGRDEDIEGRPFVGKAGQLLDKMFAAISLSRTSPDPQSALYITNILPWRPPQNRDPTSEEIAMLMPFVERHVALVDPAVIVLMGNTPCVGVLGHKGITRLRGTFTQAYGRPVLPMFHPAYLLRDPSHKREAWADLLALQARLRG